MLEPTRTYCRDDRSGDDESGGASPAHLPAAHPAVHPVRLVHLGHQHPFPARRRPQQRRSFCRQRVLHRRHGDLRGAHRGAGGHLGTASFLPARRRHAPPVDPALPRHVAGPCAALGLGRGVDPARAGVHLLLRRDRGLAGGRARVQRLQRRAGIGVGSGSGGGRRRDARWLGGGRRRCPGDQSRRALYHPRGMPRAHLRGCIPSDEGPRLHPGAEPRVRWPRCAWWCGHRSTTDGGSRRCAG